MSVGGGLSAQCGAGYHILCRAHRAGQCACRCHEIGHQWTPDDGDQA